MKLLVKICGMKHNVMEVAALSPEFLGFIFYAKSSRNYTEPIINLTNTIKKVGVFVNDSMDNILKKVKEHSLSVIQLHGDEDVIFVEELRAVLDFLNLDHIAIWKVFPIGDSFDFNKLFDYEPNVEAFLFDTKGIERGGTGKQFNWEILVDYPLSTPIVLSGGIGPDSLDSVKKFIDQTQLPIIAVDVNSKFETEPGRKDIAALKTFMDEL